jgi:hypothetical protein
MLSRPSRTCLGAGVKVKDYLLSFFPFEIKAGALPMHLKRKHASSTTEKYYIKL